MAMKYGRLGVCFWVAVCLVAPFTMGQDRVIFRDDDEDDNVMFLNENLQRSVKIPEKLLIRMKDIHNASDFLNRFVEREEIFSADTPINSRRNSPAGIPLIAKAANCVPEQKVVELERPGNGAIFLWPPCVRVRRCGGCCTSKSLTCTPIAASFLNVTVFQVRYNPQNPNSFQSQGVRTFSLEQHDRCICDCIIKAEHCNLMQEYRPDECRCSCYNQEFASQCTGATQIWDSEDCMCKCRQIYDCSTGSFFNSTKCRCEGFRRSLDDDSNPHSTTSAAPEEAQE